MSTNSSTPPFTLLEVVCVVLSATGAAFLGEYARVTWTPLSTNDFERFAALIMSMSVAALVFIAAVAVLQMARIIPRR